MGSVLTNVVAGLLRYALAGVTGWMISKGIASPEDVEFLIAGLATTLFLVGSAFWVKYRDKLRVLTALQLPQHSTEADLKAAVKIGNTAKPKILGVLLLCAAMSAGVGCASSGTFVDLAPTAEEQAAARADATKAAYALKAGTNAVRELGHNLDQLPLPLEAKNRLDCAITKAMGTSVQATPAVVEACGAVPLADSSPLTLAAEGMRAVASCASLSSTLRVARAVVDPIIAELMASDQIAVRLLGTSLSATLAIVVNPNDSACAEV